MLQETQAAQHRRISKPPQQWVWRDPQRRGSRRGYKSPKTVLTRLKTRF
jgi:hypothetical protein